MANHGQTAALLVWLQDGRPDADGDFYLSDNHISLLPGEQRTIGVSWASGGRACRPLRVSAWNAAALDL